LQYTSTIHHLDFSVCASMCVCDRSGWLGGHNYTSDVRDPCDKSGVQEAGLEL